MKFLDYIVFNKRKTPWIEKVVPALLPSAYQNVLAEFFCALIRKDLMNWSRIFKSITKVEEVDYDNVFERKDDVLCYESNL